MAEQMYWVTFYFAPFRSDSVSKRAFRKRYELIAESEDEALTIASRKVREMLHHDRFKRIVRTMKPPIAAAVHALGRVFEGPAIEIKQDEWYEKREGYIEDDKLKDHHRKLWEEFDG